MYKFFIINIIFTFLYFVNNSFGYVNNVCQIETDGGLIDLSPLTLPHGGYYAGSFFDYAPKSFSLLFNICGYTTRCNDLGSNTKNTNAESCAFYQNDGSAPPMGYIDKSELIEIKNGVSLSYGGGKNGTTQLIIYCDPHATSLNIYDCIRINTAVPLYKCSMFSMYACPILSPSSSPTPTITPPSPTPTITPSPTPTITPTPNITNTPTPTNTHSPTPTTPSQTITPSPNPTSTPPSIIYNNFNFFGNLCPKSGYNVTIGNCMNLCDFERISILPTDIQNTFEIQLFLLTDKTCSNGFENIKLQCSNETGVIFDQFEVYCETLVPTTSNPNSK
ncbi:hypothetical protein ACTFIZ_004877 [Dictyostelium cf. discoideum]